AHQSTYARGRCVPSARASAANPWVPCDRRMASRSQASASLPVWVRKKAIQSGKNCSESGSGLGEIWITSSNIGRGLWSQEHVNCSCPLHLRLQFVRQVGKVG